MTLDSLLVDLETVADATDAGAAGDAAAAPPAEDATGAAPEPSAGAEPSAPAFDPAEIQAELEFVRAQNQQLAQLLQAQQQPNQAGQTPALPDFDPFDAASVKAWNEARDQQLLAAIDQRLTPIAQQFQQQSALAQRVEGDALIADVVADDVARNGEFASDPEADREAREMVIALARAQWPEYVNRYGATDKAAEIALTKTAEQVRRLFKTVGGAAVSQRDNALATLAGATGEPGIGASAGVPGISVPAADLRRPSLAAKYGRE